MIIALIASLLSVIGVLLITSFVYFAGDEIQILFEMPEVDVCAVVTGDENASAWLGRVRLEKLLHFHCEG